MGECNCYWRWRGFNEKIAIYLFLNRRIGLNIVHPFTSLEVAYFIFIGIEHFKKIRLNSRQDIVATLPFNCMYVVQRGLPASYEITLA
jgi:hypothetical protein